MTSEALYVIIHCGLGNQLFQVAFGLAEAKRRGCQLHLIPCPSKGRPLLVNKLMPQVSKHIIRNPWLHLIRCGKHSRLQFLTSFVGNELPRFDETLWYRFDTRVAQQRLPMVFDGFWQCIAYFREIAPKLAEDLRLAIGESHNVTGRPLVAIHMRRGDYISAAWSQVQAPAFFLEAIQECRKQLDRPRFHLFTDDKFWAAKHVANYLSDKELLGVHSSGSDEFGTLKDFRLMASCDHFVISSTYSWWAAFAGANCKKRVYVPRQWLAVASIDELDLLLPGWEVL